MLEQSTSSLDAGGFFATHWSMVVACAGEHGDVAAEQALAQLCRDYWSPICAFIRRRGLSLHDAQDLTQGFFAYLIESRAHGRADPAKGRFRSYLLGTLKHFLSAVREREGRQKRGGDKQFVFLDHEHDAAETLRTRDLTLSEPTDEERAFDWFWAATLVEHARTALSEEYAKAGKEKLLGVLSPFLCGGANLPSQAEAAQSLGIPLETLRSHLSRLRARYRELLRAEVTRTLSSDEKAEEELSYLCRVLLAAGSPKAPARGPAGG